MSLIIGLCIFYALLNVAGTAMIKLELQGRELTFMRDYWQLLLSSRVIIGFCFIFISALVMFKALSGSRFSMVIPAATGINFLFTVFVGLFLFHDKLTFYNLAGMFLILAGIALMAISKAA